MRQPTIKIILHPRIPITMIPNFGTRKNNSIRIFISSTFRDLQDEREILVRSVFPRLRSAFADRSVEIIDVDLRWGLPDDLAESGKIIEICLGEVLRCKPFFLGIIGNRYGYEPDAKEIGNASECLKNYVGRNDVLGMSITEMEIRTGMNPLLGKTEYSFYMKPGDDAEKKLGDLKTELGCHGAKYYDDLDSFEKLAYSTLYSQIDREVPKMDLPYGDDSYPVQLSVLNERSHNYIPLQSDGELVDFIERNRFVYIQGGKGSGKTSRMAFLIKEFGVVRNKEVFFHFSGIEPHSSDLQNIATRLMKFVEAHVGPVKITSESGESRIKEILGHWPRNRDLYIFLDAIEKIQTKHRLESELSEIVGMYPTVRIISSGVNVVGESNVPEFRIPPLDVAEKKKILETYLRKYGKSLSKGQSEIIISNRALDSPLMLRVASNLLRVYGDYDSFGDYVNKVSAASNLEQLYDLICGTVRAIFTRFNRESESADRALYLLVYSYKGLRESDLGNILGISTFFRVTVLQAFELFITNIDGRLKIDHDLLSECIIRKGCAFEKEIRGSLVSYFSGCTDNAAYAELAFQYGKLQDRRRLAELLLRKNVCYALRGYDYHLLVRSFNLLKGDTESIVNGFGKNMGTEDLPVVCPILVDSGCFLACKTLANADLGQLDKHDELTVLNARAKSEYKLGDDSFGRARETYRAIIREFRENYPDDRIGVCEYVLKYGISCVSGGRVKEAIEAYEYIVNVFREEKMDSYISSWGAGNLAGCYLRIGDTERSLPFYRYAIETRKSMYGDESPEVAWEYCYFWSYLAKTESFEEAIKLSKKAVDIYRRTFGETSVECAWSLLNYGNSLLMNGRYDEAYRVLSESIRLNDSVLPVGLRPHSYSLTAYNNRALIDAVKGSSDTAELEKILEYKNDKNSVSHPYNANTLICMGSSEKNVGKSVEYYERALKILENSQYAGGPDSCFVRLCIFIRNGTPKEELPVLLSEFDDIYLKNPDIAFLIQCIGGKIDVNHCKLTVSYNNGSELICFPLDLFE